MARYKYSAMRVASSDQAHHGNGCGWPCWAPSWLHKLATFPYFLACLCINAMLQGMIVNGLISTSISSIEKRFNLTSTKSGIFSATYDVAVFFMLIPLSYMADKVNKVRCIGYGMVLVGIGSILNTFPHFLDGNYSVGELRADICMTERAENCNSIQTISSWSYPVLLMSQVLVGIGAAPIFTYGYSTIDEFDSCKRTAKNMAFYMGAATLGPAIAFIGGGQLLNLWGDIGKTDYKSFGIIGPQDPRWYGAWWLGFDIVGILCIIMALPLTMFPKVLNDTERRKKGDIVQTHSLLNVDFSGQSFAYIKTFKLFLFNGTCMSLIAMQTIESLIMNGYITFVPKLFENVFGFSSSFSSTITGAIVVPMGVIGSWLGGKLAGMVENKVVPILKMCIMFIVVTIVCSACLLLQCEEMPIAGINRPYEDQTTHTSRNNLTLMPFSVSHSCNSNCSCDNMFNPVCSLDGKLGFFSPCHAGCAANNPLNGEYSQCGCALLYNSSTSQVKKGWCSSDCRTTQYIFFTMFAIMCLSIFALAPLIQSASMRIVSFDHRDSYICFSWLWMRALGSVPGAIFFGWLIDITCLYWTAPCSSDPKCVLYSAHNLGLYIFFFTIFTKSLCILSLVFTIKSYIPIDAKEDIKSPNNDGSRIHAVAPVQSESAI